MQDPELHHDFEVMNLEGKRMKNRIWVYESTV
jgi:hypothetical protein